MGLRRFALISLLVPALAGCATTGGAAGQKTDGQQLKEKAALLETQLKAQQDENAMLKQQLAVTSVEKKEVRMPSGKEIQTALKKAGYYNGDVDGQIGSKTRDALKKFQSANGLNPDGVFGSRTWAILSKYLDQGG